MNEKGVSEIVGERLLLSITLILVAVLASSISGRLPEYSDVPYANFLGKFESDVTVIVHEGGDSVSINDLRVIITKKGETISCNFEGYDLYCNGILIGKFEDQNGNYMWDFGEVLKINGTVERVVIAHEKNVLCKIFY